MKRKTAYILGIVLLLQAVISGNFNIMYASSFVGSGTVDDPYRISTKEELAELNRLSNTEATSAEWASKHYILTNDIDMEGMRFDGLFCKVQGVPDFNDGAKKTLAGFSGVFDGNGHIIKNISIDAGTLQRARGFISYSENATIKNLGIESSTIRGNEVGAILGRDDGGNSVIENCYAKNITLIHNMSFNPNKQGGIIGFAKNSTLSNCYTRNLIDATAGLVAAGKVSINNSYTDASTIHKNIADATTSNVYSVSSATDIVASTLGTSFESDENQINDSFPVLKWQNKNDSDDGEDEDDTPTEPDIPSEEPPVEPDPESDSPFSAKRGNGSEESPYEIMTPNDLVLLNELSNTQSKASNWNTKHYILTKDIDMTGKRFDGLFCEVQGVPDFNNGYTVTVAAFEGVFDGNGHVISNLSIDAGNLTRSRGFISYTKNATVKNLGIESSTIRGTGIGAIVGNDNGGNTLIEGCYAKNITLVNNLSYDGKMQGGIIGKSKDTTVVNCYTISVTGATAGICGDVSENTTSSIKNSYTTLSLIGANNGKGSLSEDNTYTMLNFDEITSDALGKAFERDKYGFNDHYPVLLWQNTEYLKNNPDAEELPDVKPEPESDSPFSSKKGLGTEEYPYEITTADDLVLFNELSNTQSSSSNWNTKHYILADDIDMTGKRFDGLFCEVQGVPDFNNGYTVTVAAFEGVFDGNGHVISNLSIDAGNLTRSRGFISYTKNATVKNLGIENSTIRGTGIGAIVGNDEGGTIIESCYAKNITLINNLGYDMKTQGGIIGRAKNTIVSNCYAVSVIGATAGICGDVSENTTSTIKNSYTTHSLIGANNGKGILLEENTYSMINGAQITEDNLGDAFEADTNGINDQLPVLKWENVRFTFLDNTALTDLSAEITSGTASGSFVVGNYRKEDESQISVVVAVYGEDDFMIKLQAFSTCVLKAKEKKEYHFEIDDVEDAKAIKVYVWDSYGKFIPYGIYGMSIN